MKYIVLEIQNNNGAISHLFDVFDDKNQAWSKYYAILSAAAISGLSVHTAMLFDDAGGVYGDQCFKNPPDEDHE